MVTIFYQSYELHKLIVTRVTIYRHRREPWYSAVSDSCTNNPSSIPVRSAPLSWKEMTKHHEYRAERRTSHFNSSKPALNYRSHTNVY